MADATATARAAIEGHLEANWSACPRQPPGGEYPDPPDVWARFDILWGDGFQETMGAGTEGTDRIVGVLHGSFFAMPGAGYGLLYDLAGAFRQMFKRLHLGAVTFGAPSGPRRVMGQTSSTTVSEPAVRERRLQVAVSVPFVLMEGSAA